MASQFQMDISNVMPILRTQNGSAASPSSAVNGDGHWISEDTYDIPGGKVDTIKESSVKSGQGWHSHATKQTSIIKQELSGSDLKPPSGMLPSQSDSQSGAVKLLGELDTFSGFLNTDLSNSDVTQSVKTTTSQSKTVKLSKVSSAFHGQPLDQAIKQKYLNTKTGIYTDCSGKSHTLAEALEKDLINPDSAVFINPKNNMSGNLHNAIQRELVSKTGQYRDPATNRLMSLEDCLAKSIVVSREVQPIDTKSEGKEEHYEFHIDKVVDPTTGELISVEQAVHRGIFDPAKGKYFNLKTGELLTVQEAVFRNLMITSAKGVGPTTSSSSQLIKTSKSFNVVGAIHPILKKRMSLNEAISEGILDRSRGLYIDTLNNKTYKIQDAIQRGLVVAEEVNPSQKEDVSSEIVTNQQTTFTVTGVIHPQTKERLSVSKATELGILDTSGGQYINPVSGEIMSLNEAIEKDLVLVEKGIVKREDRDRKVSSLHIDEEEEEVWTVVEEVKTETKKWVITSVVDPRTREKISFDDALIERVLDQENGKYCNPETGEQMTIGQAIEKGLIQGELVSVNMDAGEYSSFQATADNIEHVRDPRTHKVITYDAACKLGLIDKESRTFHNPITNQNLSIQEATQRGFIKKKMSSRSPSKSVEPEPHLKAANAVDAHRNKFNSNRSMFEDHDFRDDLFGESFKVEETTTLDTEYIHGDKPIRPVIQSSSLQRPLVTDPKLLNRVDAVLDRAKLYTDESVISSTENHMSGYTTDWHNERVYNLRTGEELTLDQAVQKGLLDAKQVKLMRGYKNSHNPSKLFTETSQSSSSTNVTKSHSSTPYGRENHIKPAGSSNLFASNSQLMRGKSRSPSIPNDTTSMVVQVSQTEQSLSRIGPLTYNAAVRLGLFNIKTGKYRDPTSGLVLGIQDAVSKGFIQANGDALTNLNTGTPITLADCIQRNLIDSETGKIFESKLKQLNIAVPNQFMSSRSTRYAPINFEDALKVGLLNPYTAEFQHPQSDEVSTLGDAVVQQYISGKSVVVQDPATGKRYYLDEALKRGLISPDNGDIFDTRKGEKVMTLYEALKTKLFESVYDPFDSTLLDPNNGHRVDVNQAVKRSMLGHNTCIIYDTERGRQVSFDEAIDDDIIDRHMAMYVDKKGGRRLMCKTAAEMGLIEPIGSPVLGKLRVLESIHKLYAAPGDSISAPSYTMYEDVKSTAVSTVSKPDVRTEVDMQEYKTERTIKLSGKSEDKVETEIGPGDKVLIPKPFKPGRAAPKPQLPVPQKPVRSKHLAKSQHGKPVAEDQITPLTKKPAERPKSPEDLLPRQSAPSFGPPVLGSPGEPKIISVTEEVYETVETTANTKANRKPVDDISAPEYFIKGEAVEVQIEDDEIDSYHVELKTERPPEIDWDLSLQQKPGKEQTVTKVVEEVVEEVLDNAGNQQQVANQPLQITVESTEKETPLQQPVEEPVNPNSNKPVERGTEPSPPQRIRDKEIIIIEHEGATVTKNININIESALEEGYIDLAKREFTNPTTGEKMPLIDAIKKGYIQGSDAEIKDAITSHYEKMKLANLKKAIMEYSTTKEFSSFVEKEHNGMPLTDALAGKHLDPRSGKFVDPSSGLTYTLKEAINHGMLDGESAEFTNPGNKKTYSLKEALERNVLDSYGKWTSPLTGQKSHFADAIKKGHVCMISTEQTINKMTTITEIKKVEVQFVIHPVTTERIDYNQAVIEGIISTVDGIYRNPATNDTLSLDDAVKYGLISGKVIDTNRKTEEKILDSTNIVSHSMDERDGGDSKQLHESSLHVIKSPMKSYVIDTVVDPRTNRTLSAGEAIKLGIIDPATATYHNIVTGESMTFEEAIKRQLLRCMETTDLPDGEKFNILGVICPRTNQEISLSQALDEGVIDFGRGVYVNTVTRRNMSFADAIDRKLMRCEGRLPEGMTNTVRNEEEENVTNAVYTEQKSYTITGARDTLTGKTLGIKEAIRRGILDSDLSTYKDLRTGRCYTIQEAIDEGMLVATLDDNKTPKDSTDTSMKVNTTKTFDIEAVIDPKTQKEVSAEEAVQRGIIDEATGDYVNVDTMESWSMDNAIKQGLVKARPIPANDTVSFSICAVVDPKTGEKMTVSDALRHGFLDRGRKHFCNAHTGQLYSLDEALHNGWIITKSNYDRNRTQAGFSFKGQPNRSAQAPVSSSGFQTFTILSVTDARTGEDLTVAEAVRRGILDSSKRNYRDTLAGEVMLLDTAVKRNFIKLGPSSSGVTKTTFSDALRRGYINAQTGRYACPSTGQVMSVDEAVRRGLLVDDTGHRLGGEDMTLKPNIHRQSKTFESALRHGMIDTRSGKYLNPESGEAMTLGRAVNQGHLAPKTQWRAYKTQQHQQTQQQFTGPPSPGSVISSATYKQNGEPVYSTIHKTRTMSSTPHSESGPIDIYTARDRGLLNMQAGEVTLPQYGTSMLIDDALLQGLIVTAVPLNIILSKPASPSALSVHQAIQQGLVNPLTLAVQSGGGQFISFEDALAAGLLYPRASSSIRQDSSFVRDGSLARENMNISRAASVPTTGTPPAGKNYSYSYRKRTAHHSTGTQPRNRDVGVMNGAHMMNGGAHLKPGVGTLPHSTSTLPHAMPATQHRVWENQQHMHGAGNVQQPGFDSLQGGQAQSPLLNGNAHFVNGKLFASRPGYKIEGDGMVVNLMNGEAMGLAQAQRANIVQQIPDDEYDAGTLPPNQSMYQRDVLPHATASAASHLSADAIATGLNSFQPVQSLSAPIKPPRVSFGGSVTAPPQSEFYSSRSEQYYAEIKH